MSTSFQERLGFELQDGASINARGRAQGGYDRWHIALRLEADRQAIVGAVPVGASVVALADRVARWKLAAYSSADRSIVKRRA